MYTVRSPLRDNASDLDSEAFDKASTAVVVNFYRFKVGPDIEHDTSSSLPVFMKQPVVIHCKPPVI